MNGTYILSAQVRGSGAKYAMLLLKRNNDVVCKIWVIDDYAAANTCTAPMKLTAGDSVKVTGSDITGRIRTNVMHFAGHLIQADYND